MSGHQNLKKHETAKKVATIASQVIGFPYATRRSTEEGTVWEIFANSRLYHRILRKKYGRDYYFPTKKVQREIGMNFDLSNSLGQVKYKENGFIQFESDIMLDLAWSIENDDFNMPNKSIQELDNPKNWPKWSRKMPVTITMLQKCHEVAKGVSEKSGIEIVVSRDGYSKVDDEFGFETSFDASGMAQGQFLKEVERHCKAMVKAYKKYEPWLTGAEYWKLIHETKHAKKSLKK